MPASQQPAGSVDVAYQHPGRGVTGTGTRRWQLVVQRTRVSCGSVEYPKPFPEGCVVGGEQTVSFHACAKGRWVLDSVKGDSGVWPKFQLVPINAAAIAVTMRVSRVGSSRGTSVFNVVDVILSGAQVCT